MVAATNIGAEAGAEPARELEAERRVLLSGVPWATYVTLRDTVESRGVRMTYLEGWLEIVTNGRTHEVSTSQIARLLELFCLERDIPLFAYGSTTYRKEEADRGLEPDRCYSRDQGRALPQIALEVVVANPLLNKLDVYRGLGIQEVWIFKVNSRAFSLYTLRGEAYEATAASEILPEAPLDRIAHYALLTEQHEALKAFRDELRDVSAP
jgi:Uma2 family endonuclease